MCLSHSRGDSGCPCSAFLIGITYPSGIGSFPSPVHHSLYWASGYMKNGSTGAGASAKAFPTSYPLQYKFSAADIAHVKRWIGCSTHAAYVSANITASPYLERPVLVRNLLRARYSRRNQILFQFSPAGLRFLIGKNIFLTEKEKKNNENQG